MLDLEGHHLGEQVKRHLADLGGVILVLVGHSGGDEVGVPDGLHLVARWQNLIPFFPWIAPGWRAWGANQGKEGIKFCSLA